MSTNQSKGKIKLGIYAMAILMMGVVGVSSSLTVIGAHFADASQNTIQSLISIPCLVILPATLISGKLMDFMPKKILGIIGIVFFLIGGIVPAVMNSITSILVMRAVFGIGVGIVQSTTAALVAENFEGAEYESVQGQMTSFQFVGCAVMMFVGGWLGDRAWNLSFYVHAVAIISIILALICLPVVKPAKKASAEGEAVHKTTLTKGSWSWAFILFVLFLGVQVLTVYMSYLLAEKGIGGASQSGLATAVSCIAGVIMGLLFGKLMGIAKNLTFAIGCLMMALGYFICGMAGSIALVLIGCFVYGLAMATTMPAAFVATANSVDMYSAAMALSIATCMQNLAQFLAPYLFNAVVGATGSTKPSTLTYLLAAALLAILGVCAVIWGARKNAAQKKAGAG